MTRETYECLRLEVADGVGRIVFDMPEFANALTRAGVGELLDALNACESDPDVGAVVLTGRLKVEEVTAQSLDLLLGEIYEAVELSFRPLVTMAFRRD